MMLHGKLSRALSLILLAVVLVGAVCQYYYGIYAKALDVYNMFNDFSIGNNDTLFNATRSEFSILQSNFSAVEEEMACIYPRVDPFEPSVMAVAGLDTATITCEGLFLPDITYIKDKHILVNITKVNETVGFDNLKDCKYRLIWRGMPSDKYFKHSEWSKGFTEKIELPSDAEFLTVKCTNSSDIDVSRSYFALVPRRSELDNQFDLLIKKREIDSAPKETLNVIMLGLDSLPRNQFLRALNKTYAYLNTLETFDFAMHAQLGSNTFPNVLSMYTGRSIEETNRWWKDDQLMDAFDLIWHYFTSAGFRTLYTEDSPKGGAFHYLRKGFERPFALYNSRPLAVAMQEDDELWNKDILCAGNKIETNFHLDYLMRFLDTFKEKPVLAVALVSKVTHDYLSWTKKIDDHLLDFMKSLETKGHLNRSLVIHFSDHGTRWGGIRDSVNGIWESRTPYLIMTIPKWLLQKYPEVARNLRMNTKRLTSHIDTHATLRDLLYFRSPYPSPVPPLRHGISLFDPVPKNRTCQDLPVPVDFCMCGASLANQLNNTDKITKKLAKLVLKEINHRVDYNICSTLQLKKVIRVFQFLQDKGNTQFLIQIQTLPGEGIFEASVVARKTLTEFSVGKGIDRQNVYQGQSDCVTQSEMRPFCYCKNLLS